MGCKRVVGTSLVALYSALIYYILFGLCDRFSMLQGYQCDLTNKPYIYLALSLLVVLSSIFIPFYGKKPSYAILWVLFYSHIIPSVLFLPIFSGASSLSSLVWGGSILFLFSALSSAMKMQDVTIKRVVLPNLFLKTILALITIIFIGVLINDFGVKLSIPSIDDVYEVRREYKTNVSFLGGYIGILAGFFLAPVLIILSIKVWKKNRLKALFLFFIGAMVCLLIYSVSGFKSVAFSAFAVFLSYFMLQRSKNIGYFFTVLMPTILIISLLFSVVFGVDIILEHWVRRTLVVPGMNVAYYYDLFVIHSEEVSASVPLIVSQIYYGTNGSANAGFLGDALVSYGYSFIWIAFLIFLVILKVADSFSKGIDENLACSLLLLSAYAFSNSATSTVMLTYGFAPILLFFYFYRRWIN